MRIDLWTLALQTVNALVLVWLLARFLFRPIAAVLAERRAAAARLLDEAATAKQAAEHQATDLAIARAGLAAEAEQAMADAHDRAAAEREAVLAQARTAAAQLRTEAQTAIAHEREAAQAELEQQAGDLAVWITTRLLAALPADALAGGFVAALRAELEALPEPTRHRLLSDGDAVEVVSATPLDAAAHASLQALLGEASPRFSVDPALIAGLELRTPHATVRTSLRAALDRIAAELARRDGDAAAA